MAPKTNEKSKYNIRDQKARKLKKGSSDPDHDNNIKMKIMDDDDDDDDDEDESDYETVSETDSTYTPPKKSKSNANKNAKNKNAKNNAKLRSNKRTVIEYDDDDDDDNNDNDDDDDEDDDDDDNDDDDDDDDNGDDDDDDDESSGVDPRELRKTIAALFPSNYINKKVRADDKMNRREKQYKKSSKKGRRNRRRQSPSEDEDDDNDDDDDDDDEDDDDDDDDDANDFNIIFTALGGGGSAGNERDEKDENAIQDDADEECDSDDEKTFMKETYEPISVVSSDPSKLVTDVSLDKTNKNDKSKSYNSKKGKKSGKHNRTENSDKSDDVEPVDAGSEYNELVELKKHLTEKLAKKPNSKILIHAIDECRTSIKKLVKKTRMKNAKKYYKMVNTDIEQNTSEIDYFKTKLSNKEQMRAMKELKQINDHITIKKPYRLTLLDSNIPHKYKATVMQKLNMLRSMEPGDPEYYKLKTWVDTFMRIPFCSNKSLSVNIGDGIDKCSDFMENAKRILDECVYGLDDAKMQIMQMVGQWITNPEAMGSAIAIKGPMGTGKTTLVKEGISKILGREFAFIALGGTGDASFLEGHSYTYEGSLWGKIVQILIDSKCMNPVIYFDELDKVSDTPRGEEIIGVLTHLTDTTQNNQFHDKYFAEIDFDLSKCLFIFSYNDESKVNPILRDRMYRIQTKGYDAKEKMIIARNYLLPKIREQVSFVEGDIEIPDETLNAIISNKSITREEDGVRNLKRCLEIIHTKLNLFRLMRPENNLFAKDMDMTVTFPFTVGKKSVDKLIKNEENQNQSLLAMYV